MQEEAQIVGSSGERHDGKERVTEAPVRGLRNPKATGLQDSFHSCSEYVVRGAHRSIWQPSAHVPCMSSFLSHRAWFRKQLGQGDIAQGGECAWSFHVHNVSSICWRSNSCRDVLPAEPAAVPAPAQVSHIAQVSPKELSTVLPPSPCWLCSWLWEWLWPQLWGQLLLEPPQAPWIPQMLAPQFWSLWQWQWEAVWGLWVWPWLQELLLIWASDAETSYLRGNGNLQCLEKPCDIVFPKSPDLPFLAEQLKCSWMWEEGWALCRRLCLCVFSRGPPSPPSLCLTVLLPIYD